MVMQGQGNASVALPRRADHLPTSADELTTGQASGQPQLQQCLDYLYRYSFEQSSHVHGPDISFSTSVTSSY